MNQRRDLALQTEVAQARNRVQTERDALDDRASAFETFLDRVSNLAAEGPTSTPPSIAAGAGTQSRISRSGDDGCQRVRTAFDETIRPRSVDDMTGTESLMETIRVELTDDIALALAPTTRTSLTPELKRAIITEAEVGLAEANATRKALHREETILEAVLETVNDITSWIAESDETPLTALEFDALRRRHQTLARHREECERLAAERQAFLDGTTAHGAQAEVKHRFLVTFIYQELSSDYPVLSAVSRLAAACEECQRAVRAHLVRRV
ncbi:hypothetical protein ELS19_10110 [Halogeometricum borinquense]|uniref:DUF7260 domain-containing protein n=1 Tax=Halogeometricum borinquense TaxID=60847 RepID=A0A482TLZ4_9EURY|nr:hypothetical protein [Halogeometricum borinquense]RYJ14281.1 hypothetical protein ELS19_10110 [Halogeometricum borinquense]